MPFGNTTKYLLRKMTGASLVRDIDDGFAALADDVDANMAGYAEGTIGARPAASKAGRFYRATDTGKLYFDTGSAWLEMGFASTGFQPGDLKLTTLTAVPAGWLLFNGQTVLRTTFADLWTVAQTEIANGNPLYNTGNGTTTFGLADCRGQAVLMAGQGSGLTNRPLGNSGGEENHVLIENELAPHDHADSFAVSSANVAPAVHVLAYAGGVVFDATNYATGGGPSAGPLPRSTADNWGGTSGAHSHALAGAVLNAGGGAGHNNMQPWRAFNLLVKT